MTQPLPVMYYSVYSMCSTKGLGVHAFQYSSKRFSACGFFINQLFLGPDKHRNSFYLFFFLGGGGGVGLFLEASVYKCTWLEQGLVFVSLSHLPCLTLKS
jgi:hypothetical protein